MAHHLGPKRGKEKTEHVFLLKQLSYVPRYVGELLCAHLCGVADGPGDSYLRHFQQKQGHASQSFNHAQNRDQSALLSNPWAWMA